LFKFSLINFLLRVFFLIIGTEQGWLWCSNNHDMGFASGVLPLMEPDPRFKSSSILANNFVSAPNHSWSCAAPSRAEGNLFIITHEKVEKGQLFSLIFHKNKAKVFIQNSVCNPRSKRAFQFIFLCFSSTSSGHQLQSTTTSSNISTASSSNNRSACVVAVISRDHTWNSLSVPCFLWCHSFSTCVYCCVTVKRQAIRNSCCVYVNLFIELPSE